MRSTHLIILQLGTEFQRGISKIMIEKYLNRNKAFDPPHSLQLNTFSLQGLIFTIICILVCLERGKWITSPNPDPSNQKPHTRQSPVCVLSPCQGWSLTTRWYRAPREKQSWSNERRKPHPVLIPPGPSPESASLPLANYGKLSFAPFI